MTPIARFLQINELHLQDPKIPRKHYAGAWSRADWLFRSIREGSEFPPLDFILGLGDFADGPSIAEIQADLLELKNMMGELPCPIYPCVGNHDIGKQEGDPTWEAPFLTAFGLDSSNYTFEQAGVQFVMLNNAGTTVRDAATYDKRAGWLVDTLASIPGPVFLCCHMPLVPMREQHVLIDSCRFDSWKTQEPEILEIVNSHRDKVAAVISGHLHLTAAVEVDGILHIDIAGVASFPSDVALYSIFADHVDVKVIQLPAHLLDRGTTIHGRPRHDLDYSDANHLTPELYLTGNPDERDFRIPLK